MPEADEVETPKGRPARAWLTRGLHLVALSSLALAQPLYATLDDGALFIALDADRWEIILLALAIAFGPPCLLLLTELAVAMASGRAGELLHLAFVAGLAAVLASQALVSATVPSSRMHVLVMVVVAALSALAYAHLAPLRATLTLLAAAAPVFLALFLFATPVGHLTIGEQRVDHGRPIVPQVPVVMVVFDELPGFELMDRRGRINSARFPNFARLARASTWFRNATTVHDFTDYAVPAIVSGEVSKPQTLPTSSDHPNSLFELFDQDAVYAEESLTQLCPRQVCPPPGSLPGRMRSLGEEAVLRSLMQWLPSALHRHLPQGKDLLPHAPSQVDDFNASLGKDPRARLHYLHVLLPHSPWIYLPSGKHHAAPVKLLLDPGGEERWGPNRWRAIAAQQKHLMQLVYTDRVLGSLIDRLEDVGLYDRALLVVVADHGVSFLPNTPLREATAANAERILSVPLFVKKPRQRRGAIDDSPVRTTDVAPTVAEVLGVRLPWRTHGASVFDTRRPDPRVLDYYPRSGKKLEISVREFERRRDAAVVRHQRIFGTGVGDLFRMGSYPRLTGRRPVARAAEAAGVAIMDGPLRSVDLSSSLLRVSLAGEIVGRGAEQVRDLAIAVNGRVAVTTRTYRERRSTVFSTLIPESAFRQGSNRFRVYAISRSRGGARLRLLPDQELSQVPPS